MSEKEPEKKPTQLKLGHNMYTSQIDPSNGIPDFMEIEPLNTDEFSDHQIKMENEIAPKREATKPTKKSRRIHFSGKGLFSTISPKERWGTSDESEMVRGILNYDQIATDPNYGKIK